MKPSGNRQRSVGAIWLLLVFTAADPTVAADRQPTGAGAPKTLHQVMKNLNQEKKKAPTRYTTGRQRIVQQLRNTRLPEIQFDGLTLEDVMEFLAEEWQQRDPDNRRINYYFVNPSATQAPSAQPATVATGATDPLGADPNAAVAAPAIPVVPAQLPLDLANVEIQLRNRLVGLNGLQILDVVAKTADQPIRFSINDYAIVAMPKGGAPLYIRNFRANPNTFRLGLQGVTALNPGVVGNTAGASGAGGGAGNGN